jgi:hypothetical protein
VHRQVLAEGLLAARDADQHADPPVAVDVAGETLSGTRGPPGEASDLDVLLEGRDQLRDLVSDSLAAAG